MWVGIGLWQLVRTERRWVWFGHKDLSPVLELDMAVVESNVHVGIKLMKGECRSTFSADHIR